MTIEKLISILNQRTGLEYSYSEDDNFYYIWVIVDDTKHGRQQSKETIHNTSETSFRGKKLIEMLTR